MAPCRVWRIIWDAFESEMQVRLPKQRPAATPAPQTAPRRQRPACPAPPGRPGRSRVGPARSPSRPEARGSVAPYWWTSVADYLRLGCFRVRDVGAAAEAAAHCTRPEA